MYPSHGIQPQSRTPYQQAHKPGKTQVAQKVTYKGKTGYKVMHNGKPAFIPLPPLVHESGVKIRSGAESLSKNGKQRLGFFGAKEALKPYILFWTVIGQYTLTDKNTGEHVFFSSDVYEAEWHVTKGK